MSQQAHHLDRVLTFVPLGDEEQLGQTFGITVTNQRAKLPQELLLILEDLGVVFVVHDLLQLLVLQEAERSPTSKQEPFQIAW